MCAVCRRVWHVSMTGLVPVVPELELELEPSARPDTRSSYHPWVTTSEASAGEGQDNEGPPLRRMKQNFGSIGCDSRTKLTQSGNFITWTLPYRYVLRVHEILLLFHNETKRQTFSLDSFSTLCGTQGLLYRIIVSLASVVPFLIKCRSQLFFGELFSTVR